MTDQIHVNDIGTIFELEVQEDAAAVDISTATAMFIYLKNPAGTTKTCTASFSGDGTDGKIQYITIADDLDTEGPWEIQGKVELPGWQGYTSIVNFTVYPNLI
jgi:hypothetical protein